MKGRLDRMKRKWLVYKKIVGYLELNKIAAIIYLGLNIVLLGLEYFQPGIYQKFIDEVLIGRNLGRMKYVIFLYTAYFVLKLIFGYAKEYAGFNIHAGIHKKIKVKIFSNLFHRDFSYYDTNKSGDIQVNIEKDTESLKDFVDTYIVNYLLNFVSMAAAVILCLRLSWELTCVALVSIPVTILADHAIAKREKKIIDRIRMCEEQKVTWLNNILSNWREVKALCLEKRIIKKYVRFLHPHIILSARKIYFFVVRCLIIPWIKEKFFMQIMMYFIGGLLVISGRMHVGEVLVFIVYYGMLSKAVTAVSLANAEFEIQSGLMERVIDQIDYEEEVKGELPDRVSGEIEFKNVSFRYSEEDKYILSNINMKIEKGDRVAICGKSGSGKTTIARMMAGFYKPTEGNIYYSGRDIEDISRESLYKKIGYIRQDAVLFNASVKDNLLIANPGADDGQIESACKKALIYEYIQNLPDKYDTIIDEMGDNLSGGLKQRFILARQFLKDSEVYILDEVTSNLDRRSEKYIYQILQNMEKDRTIIYITHHQYENMFFNKVINVADGMAMESMI